MGIKEAILKSAAARLKLLRPALIAHYQRGSLKGGWHNQHPYDRDNGVCTSGMVPGFLLHSRSTAYAAAQPSIIVKAIAAIPDPEACHFLDLGCGKGRPLLIAAKAGFRRVTGVEFSPTLAGVAKRNVDIFSGRHPGLAKIEIVAGDALAQELPPGKLVIFLYNPFDDVVTAQLIRIIEASLRDLYRDLFVIYYNPIYAALFDASSALERRFAAQIAYDPDEIGFGPDESDGVVIWQNRGSLHPRPGGDPSSPVIIVTPGWRAVVS
jgi:SAM-dependent methyltransferase